MTGGACSARQTPPGPMLPAVGRVLALTRDEEDRQTLMDYAFTFVRSNAHAHPIWLLHALAILAVHSAEHVLDAPTKLLKIIVGDEGKITLVRIFAIRAYNASAIALRSQQMLQCNDTMQ